MKVYAHKVTITLRDGTTHIVDVPDGEAILEPALAAGLDIPHDCKMGVCMTCPAKLNSGSVDLGTGMLSDDVTDMGFTLLCVAMPLEDCNVTVVDDDDLLEVQLHG
eukprot:CAMPEP_0196583572 /NCGR_PEP_ID=MMETSP1081-20130531/43933_1 /TAXON_ID=36882 /ORGANISM="Pyramimonas amylifera, Strain CCMP720" /LENGTH=105 /DNA_ID=CAMNT_0041904505 /DNA_START=202 /DNA_END=519 /DNA_ORIENTATION=-